MDGFLEMKQLLLVGMNALTVAVLSLTVNYRDYKVL